MSRLILVIILFAGCIKEGDPPPPIYFKVQESVSDLPVSGASVTFHRCPRGCTAAGAELAVFTGTTDANGICKVPFKYYMLATTMDLQHSDYWPFQRFGDIQNPTYLTPIGSVQLRIRKVGNYPGNSLLNVASKSQDDLRYGDIRNFVTLEARDTTVTLRGFGGQKNKIEWEIIDAGVSIASGVLGGLQVPRFDTLKNVTLDY